MKKYIKWKKYEAQAGREQHAGMEMGPQTKRKVQAEKVHEEKVIGTRSIQVTVRTDTQDRRSGREPGKRS